MTQRDLAGGQLSVSYISLLEAGRRSPTPETVGVLARALGCRPDDLVQREPVGTQPAALAVSFGEMALEAGDPPTAQRHFQSVLDRPDTDPGYRVAALSGLAQALEREGQLADAVEAYEECVRLGAEDPGQGGSLRVVMGWCRCLYEMGELVRAVEVGNKALQEFAELRADDSELAVQLLCTVAAVYYELGDLRQAERLLTDGLDRASRLDSDRARGSVLWNASMIAHENGRFRESLELAEEALSIYRRGDDQRNLGRLRTLFGYLLLRQDPPQAERARDQLQQALAALATAGGAVDRGYALTELSRAHLALGNPELAHRVAQDSLDTLGDGAALERSRARMALSAVLRASGSDDRAQALAAQAAAELEGLGATRHAARAWIELAEQYAATGDLPAALGAYRRCAASVHLTVPAPAFRDPLPPQDPGAPAN